MNHTIPPNQHGPRHENMTHAIETCVHCGFCLSACPTYAVLGEEMDSPRGRIYLMKEVLENNLTAKEAEPYIDRCLGCLACEPACPSGVPYGELLTSYRSYTNQTRHRPLLDQATRQLISQTLPYPGRFRAAARAGAIAKLGQKFLPEPFQAMLNLLPAELPPHQPLPEVVPAVGPRRARVALLVGCVQQVLAPQINWDTVHVLAHNGVEVVIPPAQGCCGSLLAHIGELEQAQILATRNFSAFPDDVEAILTNAAGCGSGMKEYELWFKGTPHHEQATKFAHKVQDVTQFLADLGIKPPAGERPPQKLVYHDACHLLHAQGISLAPRQLLRAVPGVMVVELPDNLCCGSAGTYNLEQPTIAHELGQRKAQAIINSGGELIVTSNIGCLTQIQTHLQQLGQPRPVMHLLSFLAQAYQGIRP